MRSTIKLGYGVCVTERDMDLLGADNKAALEEYCGRKIVLRVVTSNEFDEESSEYAKLYNAIWLDRAKKRDRRHVPLLPDVRPDSYVKIGEAYWVLQNQQWSYRVLTDDSEGDCWRDNIYFPVFNDRDFKYLRRNHNIARRLFPYVLAAIAEE